MRRTSNVTTMLSAVLALCVLLLSPRAGGAASRKECKPSKCRTEIGTCKDACITGSKKEQRKCRRRCKKQVTQACRADEQSCDGGGQPGGQCAAYAPTCAVRSFEPLRQQNVNCTGASAASQPCDYGHDTKFRVRTPWRTHEGECCVVDTCRGATAFGTYDSLAFPPIIPPGSSLVLAPVTVTVQSLSNYLQKPATSFGLKGQWAEATTAIMSLGCMTPPQAKVASVAGGPVVAVTRQDYNSYDTHPVPPPTGAWDYLQLGDGAASVAYAPQRPPLLPECGSAPNTLECQAPVWKLDSVNFIGDRNPVVEVLSERISLDALCDDEIFASAQGTFRRLDGSECSVQIFARAKIGCTSDADCIPGEVCRTTDPSLPTDFGNAFPGYPGASCVLP